ncbi:MAG TPA: lipoate--protein ligase family protein [Bacteroidota bacterium]|nr:lipoate--protein ligase family protein [Bacteroidota bacterium]
MSPPLWTFMDSGERTGAFNMALDESLARSLASGGGAPSLRIFRWRPWAISLGYNQPPEDLDAARCAAEGIEIVRRPTGGRAILHAEELTYSVVMPAGRKSILQVYNEISTALVRGLALYGVEVSLQKSQPDFAREYRSSSSIPCFASSARYEIEWRGRKLVGSAQRRFSGESGDVVLQHGSILCGDAHLHLADCLAVPDAQARARILGSLRAKTADLRMITGRPVGMDALGECIRRGFALEWGLEFTAPPGVHTQTA